MTDYTMHCMCREIKNNGETDVLTCGLHAAATRKEVERVTRKMRAALQQIAKDAECPLIERIAKEALR
jgi:hypothetical protein